MGGLVRYGDPIAMVHILFFHFFIYFFRYFGELCGTDFRRQQDNKNQQIFTFTHLSPTKLLFNSCQVASSA